MKKLSISLLALISLISVSCQKETQFEEPLKNNSAKSFTASIIETKTAFGDAANDNKIPVVWQAGDAIDVYGYTEGKAVEQAKFILSEGAGETSGTFIMDGDKEFEFDQYFAFYPAGVKIKADAFPTSIEISSTQSFSSQAVVEGNYDASVAYMTASEKDGNLSFRPGTSFFKIQIPEEGVTKIALSFANKAFQARPSFSAESGAPNASNGGLDNFATVEGAFVKGSYYYISAVPKDENDATTLGAITVTFTHNGSEKSVTSPKQDIKPLVGKVYNLGCPQIDLSSVSPSIKADDVTIGNNATEGDIIYTISDPTEDGNISASLMTGKETTITSFQLEEAADGKIHFTCAANEDEETKYAYVTLSYPGAEDVSVTITQKGLGNVAATYTWDLSQWAKKKDSSSSAYYYYDESAGDYVDSAECEEYGNFYVTADLKIESSSSYYYVNLSNGGAADGSKCSIIVPVTKPATLTVWATTNKKSSENGSCTINVKHGDNSFTANLDVASGNYYDTSVELCNAKPFEFKLDGMASNVVLYKSGSNGCRIYKIVLQED